MKTHSNLLYVVAVNTQGMVLRLVGKSIVIKISQLSKFIHTVSTYSNQDPKSDVYALYTKSGTRCLYPTLLLVEKWYSLVKFVLCTDKVGVFFPSCAGLGTVLRIHSDNISLSNCSCP